MRSFAAATRRPRSGEDPRDVRVRRLEQLQQEVLDLDVVVGPRQAEPGGALEGVAAGVVQPSDQGLQIRRSWRSVPPSRSRRGPVSVVRHREDQLARRPRSRSFVFSHVVQPSIGGGAAPTRAGTPGPPPSSGRAARRSRLQADEEARQLRRAAAKRAPRRQEGLELPEAQRARAGRGSSTACSRPLAADDVAAERAVGARRGGSGAPASRGEPLARRTARSRPGRRSSPQDRPERARRARPLGDRPA